MICLRFATVGFLLLATMLASSICGIAAESEEPLRVLGLLNQVPPQRVPLNVAATARGLWALFFVLGPEKEVRSVYVMVRLLQAAWSAEERERTCGPRREPYGKTRAAG